MIQVGPAYCRLLCKHQQHEQDAHGKMHKVVEVMVENIKGLLGPLVARVMIELGITLPFLHVQSCFLQRV